MKLDEIKISEDESLIQYIEQDEFTRDQAFLTYSDQADGHWCFATLGYSSDGESYKSGGVRVVLTTGAGWDFHGLAKWGDYGLDRVDDKEAEKIAAKSKISPEALELYKKEGGYFTSGYAHEMSEAGIKFYDPFNRLGVRSR